MDGVAPERALSLRADAAGWFRAGIVTMGRMEEQGIASVRSQVNRAALEELLTRCQPPALPGAGG